MPRGLPPRAPSVNSSEVLPVERKRLVMRFCVKGAVCTTVALYPDARLMSFGGIQYWTTS
jgi:hypothetical protein